MRMFWRVAGLETIGLLVVGAAAALWLQIPDAHGWQFVVSMVLGVGMVAAFLWLQTVVVQRMRLGVSGKVVRGGAWLAGGLFVWWVAVQVVGKMSVHVVERAGYWNSRLSAHQRVFFTETRLENWQNDVISTLLWFVLPGLLIPLMVEMISLGWNLKGVRRVWARWQWWLVVAVASWAGCWVAAKLTDWHPAESVTGEVVSAVGRFGALYVFLVGVGLGVLWVAAELLRRAAGVEKATELS